MGLIIDNFYRFLSFFPSRKGEQSLRDLARSLSNGGIEFSIEEISDETGCYYVARSINLEGKIISTAGNTLSELDRNIKDALFAAYHVPSFYCREDLIRVPLPINRLTYVTA